MAQEVMKSMFGIDPGQAAMDIYDERRNDSMSRNAAIAKMTPWQQVGMFGGMAGEQLGEGLTGLAGAAMGVDTSPAPVRKARVLQGVMEQLKGQGIDFNNPEQFMPVVIDALAKNGLTKEAADMSLQYQPMKQAAIKNQYDIMGKAAEMQRKLRGIGDVSPKDFTPASMQRFNTSGRYSDLEAAEGSVAAPVLAQRQWAEALQGMKEKGQFFEDLDPYEQSRIFGLASQVAGAESAKQMFPSFTANGTMTVEEAKAMRFATMMARSEPAILQLENQGFRFSSNLAQLLASPALDKEASLLTVLKQLPISDAEMRAMDAYINFLSPALYQKTGAAVTVSEFLRDMRGAVPWQWDNEPSIKEKQNARRAQLVGTEQGLSPAGLAAYNRSLEQFNLPPSRRIVAGPLSRPVNKGATPQTGVRPEASMPFPDRSNPGAVGEWLKKATPEDKKAFLKTL